MKRADRIKLSFTRNWRLPGRERLTRLFAPSKTFTSGIRDGIVWLNNENIGIYTSGDNYIEYAIISTGTYEDEINQLIRISLTCGSYALDIGGNIGLQSLRMSQAVGDSGKVYAFEPLKYLQEKFRKNLQLNNVANVTLFPFALADTDAEAEFTINTSQWNQGTFSLGNLNQGTQKELVLIKVGDRIPELSDLPRLDLIKIDVEGFEFKVMRGLKDTIAVHRPRILFEYDAIYWQRSKQTISDCYQFLTEQDYRMYQVSPVGCELIKNAEQIEGGNLFCIPDRP